MKIVVINGSHRGKEGNFKSIIRERQVIFSKRSIKCRAEVDKE